MRIGRPLRSTPSAACSTRWRTSAAATRRPRSALMEQVSGFPRHYLPSLARCLPILPMDFPISFPFSPMSSLFGGTLPRRTPLLAASSCEWTVRVIDESRLVRSMSAICPLYVRTPPEPGPLLTRQARKHPRARPRTRQRGAARPRAYPLRPRCTTSARSAAGQGRCGRGTRAAVQSHGANRVHSRQRRPAAALARRGCAALAGPKPWR